MKNIDVVKTICALLDEARPRPSGHAALITYVKDRPGHDRRYAIDSTRVREELGWKPSETFSSGMRKTVDWYLQNEAWVSGVTGGSYRQWTDQNYLNRGTA